MAPQGYDFVERFPDVADENDDNNDKRLYIAVHGSSALGKRHLPTMR